MGSFKIPLISDQSPNGSLNGSQNAMPPIEIDHDSKEIHPFKNTTTITPEPSVDTMSMIMSSDDGSVLEESKHEKRGYSYKKHRHREKKKNHKSKKEQIRELKNELIGLQQTVNIKDSRIKDLEESNREIRKTLLLRNNKINELQSEMDALRIKLSKTKMRAQSAIFRPTRSDKKKRRSWIVTVDNGLSLMDLNLHTPKASNINTALRRSHSSGIPRQKVQSQKYFEIK